MAHYLIAGFAGSGKSTITKALQARGLPALDSDEIHGLSAWRTLADNTPVQIDYSQPIDFERIGWLWDTAVLAQTLKEHSTLFLCGNAHNLWDVVPLFDTFFALDIDPETQRERLLSRPDNIYAKEPTTLAKTLAVQKDFILKARDYGAHILDATEPIDQIVEQIIINSTEKRDTGR